MNGNHMVQLHLDNSSNLEYTVSFLHIPYEGIVAVLVMMTCENLKPRRFLNHRKGEKCTGIKIADRDTSIGSEGA